MAFMTILRQVPHCKPQNVQRTTCTALNTLGPLPQRWVHSTPVNSLFFESDPKAEYKKFRPKPSRREVLRNGLKQIKEEVQIWKNELSEAWAGDNVLAGMPGKDEKPNSIIFNTRA